MIKLPNECLFEILNKLKGFHKDLFSCLLTNRQWCRTVVPILWSDLDISKDRKLVRACLMVLNAEERAQLIPFNIIFPNDLKPLFEYTSYATVIKINSDDGIKNWLSHESSYLNHCSLVNVVQVIKHTLIVMILRTSEKLKRLSIYGKQGNLSRRVLDRFRNMISLDFKELKTLIVALHNNTTLTELNLSGNRLGSEGGKALAEALYKNTTLTHLILSHNHLGSEGGKALAAALCANSTLIHLNLGNNKLGTEGGKAIANALYKNTTLKHLNLSENQLDSEVGEAFVKALQQNTTLILLNTSKNKLSTEIEVALAGALYKNEGRCVTLYRRTRNIY